MLPLIAYVRVSTQKQGRSGLGLEAQLAAIAAFAAAEGFVITETFVEVETGKGADALTRRPKLAAAIVAAKGKTLAVAKLDRLTRDVEFGAGLLNRTNISFRVADMPHANNFMLHIMLSVAENEREMISRRTKDALAAAKARGVRLGRADIGEPNRIAAAARDADLAPILAELAALSSRAAAAEIERRGLGKVSYKTISRARARLSAEQGVPA